MIGILASIAFLVAAPTQTPADPGAEAPRGAVLDSCYLLELPAGCSQPPPPPLPPPPTVTVQPGDTFSTLAWAWGVDLAAAELANSDTVANPDQIAPGQVLRMPGGTAPPPPPPPAQLAAPSGAEPAPGPRPAVGAVGNHFSFGYCTWYVANKRPIPWFGDAGQWGPNAARMGFPEGKTPRVGAIMVTWEGPIGHVAYVESVNADGSFVVSEMNYKAWDVVDFRTVHLATIPLETFIY